MGWPFGWLVGWFLGLLVVCLVCWLVAWSVFVPQQHLTPMQYSDIAPGSGPLEAALRIPWFGFWPRTPRAPVGAPWGPLGVPRGTHGLLGVARS